MPNYVTKRARELNLKVVDAIVPLDLELRRQDVASAKQKDSKACAFAQAAIRAQPSAKHAYVFRSTTYMEYPKHVIRYKNSLGMEKAIDAFDRGERIEPGIYVMNAPCVTQTLEYHRKRDKRINRHMPRNGPIRRQPQGVRSILEPKVQLSPAIPKEPVVMNPGRGGRSGVDAWLAKKLSHGPMELRKLLKLWGGARTTLRGAGMRHGVVSTKIPNPGVQGSPVMWSLP